jgi:hypothetical protein
MVVRTLLLAIVAIALSTPASAGWEKKCRVVSKRVGTWMMPVRECEDVWVDRTAAFRNSYQVYMDVCLDSGYTRTSCTRHLNCLVTHSTSYCARTLRRVAEEQPPPPPPSQPIDTGFAKNFMDACQKTGSSEEKCAKGLADWLIENSK